jgi:putative copper resistance protein D
VTSLIGFLAVLLAGLALIGMAIAVGGVTFAVLVLRPENRALGLPDGALKRSLQIIVAGSIALAAARFIALILVPLTFVDDIGGGPAVSDILATAYARATLANVASALALACAARSMAGTNVPRRGWLLMTLAALLVLATGAWLTHAASRVQSADQLMLTTILHELGAAVWFGGIVQLALLRPLVRRHTADAELWPRVLARFSPLAFGSVVLLLAAGIYLASIYIGDWGALIGTGYGAMVVTKSALLATALGLGALNFFAVRRWRRGLDGNGIGRNVPGYVEAELAIVMTALLTAASLTSQPPAVDVQSERASAGEVLAFLAPKKPVLVPPPRDALLGSAASVADVFAVPGAVERAQNTFNHNMAGLLVLVIAIAAVLDRTGTIKIARHWPLLFLMLATFLFVFAEPTVWPLGSEAFWGTLAVPGVLQHRLATTLVVGLAVAEWRVQVGRLSATHWRFAFPVLCVAGGAMLLTHSHSVLATRSEFLIELSHGVLGLLAVLIGVGRWLELRLAHPASRAAGVLWTVCLVAVGFVLLFYRET